MTLVVFSHEYMAKLMADGEGAQGADGIDKQGVRAVERVNIAAASGDVGPTRGLNSTGDFES